jgi:hypothetical protein
MTTETEETSMFTSKSKKAEKLADAIWQAKAAIDGAPAAQAAAEAAARAESDAVDPKAAAAAALGVPRSEVAAVREDKRGAIVTDTSASATEYVIVSPDKPDALGRHGVMLLRPWHGNLPSAMPVYADTAPPEAIEQAVPIREEIPPVEELVPPPADWPETITPEVMDALDAEVARLRALLDANPNEYAQRALREGFIDRLEWMLPRWRAGYRNRAIELEEAEAELRGPTAQEIARMTAILGFCRAVAAAGGSLTSNRERELRERYMPHSSAIAMMTPNLLEHEIRCTEEWFTDRGLDVPTIELEPAAQ